MHLISALLLKSTLLTRTMPFAWTGGRERLYTNPRDYDPDGVFSRAVMDELLHPLVEVAAYGDD